MKHSWLSSTLLFIALCAMCQSTSSNVKTVVEVRIRQGKKVGDIENIGNGRHKTVVEVRLRQGKIVGDIENIDNGRRYYAFRSIPYAQPPVGDLRLRDPVPANGWTGTRNGSVVFNQCPQLNLMSLAQGKLQVDGNEDCLYLNVFTPRPFVSDLPVMVQIHGGAFQFGSIKDISPLPLLTKDVVYVNLHYRLGFLGFFSTEDSTMTGNLGLKDQTLALRWVQENIREFGGDPAKVTVFGTSAGAASSHFQVLTPYASGLFNQAILQSGTALCSWTHRKDHRQVATTVAKSLNCTGSGTTSADLDSVALLQCLQELPVERLVTAPLQFVEWSNEPLVMSPRVDGDYIPDHPARLLKEGKFNKVNLIIGTNAQDGTITANAIYSRNELRDSMIQNFSEIGPLTLNFRDGDETPEDLARRVFLHYLGAISITEDNADQVVQLFTDRLFGVCSDRTALLHARDAQTSCEMNQSHNQVYTYQLLHIGQHKFFPKPPNTSVADNWVGHADDLQYIFDFVSGRMKLERPSDLKLRNIMVELWTNFVATGNPTPDQSLGFVWEPVTSSSINSLGLKPNPEMIGDSRSQARDFMECLPTVTNKILFPERCDPKHSPGL